MQHWRHTAKTILATVLVTSAAWLIGGAIMFERWRNQVAMPGVSAAGGAVASPEASPTLAAAVSQQVEAGRLVVPVQGVRRDQLVDTFTQSRGGGARVHNAIDIMAPRGTPVVAAAPGRIEKLFVSKLGGNTVYVRSPDRTLIYYYAHLDSYAPGLTANLTVRQGEPLGTVGISGNVDPSSPHLHFEIQQTAPQAAWYQKSVSLNPYPLLTARR